MQHPPGDGDAERFRRLDGPAAAGWLRQVNRLCRIEGVLAEHAVETPPLFTDPAWDVVLLPSAAHWSGPVSVETALDHAGLWLMRNRGIDAATARAHWPPCDVMGTLWAVLREHGVEEIAVSIWRRGEETVLLGPPCSQTVRRADPPGRDRTYFLPEGGCAVVDAGGRWALYSCDDELSVLGGEPALIAAVVERLGGLPWLQAVFEVKFRHEAMAPEEYRALYDYLGWDWPFAALAELPPAAGPPEPTPADRLRARAPRYGCLAEHSPELQQAVLDPRIAAAYEAATRSYTLYFLDPDEVIPPAERARAARAPTGLRVRPAKSLLVDPWSGAELPGELSFCLEQTALTEGALTPDDLNDYTEEIIAKAGAAYHTEAWWRRLIDAPPETVLEALTDVADRLPPTPKIEDDYWVCFRTEHAEYRPFLDPDRPGISRSAEKPPHLCEKLKLIFMGPKSMFWYVPPDREYGFRILDLERPADHQPIEVFAARFCPFCGARLPESLKAERRRRLEALGCDPDGPQDALPPAFRTDAWWKEAGL